MNPYYPYGQNVAYSNYNMNNPYYNPLCNMCGGNGYYMSSGYQQPCNCSMTYNHPMGYTGQPNYEQVYYYPQRHKGLLGRIGDAFRAITGCGTCNGSGWIISKYGNQTYCPSCISTCRYCPKCNNTGIKWKNGKRCKHHFW
jgi:hypothetical protein